MAPPEFKPGMFEPVITIGHRPDGNTRAFHGDKQGLFECAEETFALAFSTASSRGANLDLSRATVKNLSKIFGQFLWARNLANQLSKVNVNQGFAREILRDLEVPEPLVKLFTAYGHFEHDQVTYVQLDLEREFCFALLDLAYMVRDTDLDADEIAVRDPPTHDYLGGVTLSPSGDVQIDKRDDVTSYLSKLLAHIQALDMPAEQRLRYSKAIIDIATERDLQSAVRWLRMQDGMDNLPDRAVVHNAYNDVMKFIRDAIGDQDTTHGASIAKRELMRSIQHASGIMRTMVDELSIVIAPLNIPKYEQGSPAQAAQTIEDITYTHFPLSLADSTVCAAFKVGRVLRRYLRGAPDDTGKGLQRELIRRSVKRKA